MINYVRIALTEEDGMLLLVVIGKELRGFFYFLTNAISIVNSPLH